MYVLYSILCQYILLDATDWGVKKNVVFTRRKYFVKLHYPQGSGACVFFFPDVASHELTVNMQDGHASQAKCCWAEESPGTF